MTFGKSPFLHEATGLYITVYIDKELQRKKSVISESGLIAPTDYEYMLYNLQYGLILTVGRGVKDPIVQKGRNAIFHHLVEEDARYLLHTYENGDEIRVINLSTDTTSHKFFGVVDEDDRIIPASPFVFCEPDLDKPVDEDYEILQMEGLGDYRVAAKKEGMLYVPQNVPADNKHKFNYRTRVLYTHPEETEFEAGEEILVEDFARYPINLYGVEYWVCNKMFILAKLHQF